VVVASDRRRAGLGRRLIQWIEAALIDDARRSGGELRRFVAELNDPFKSPADDSLDAFQRLLVWNAWGYAKLDFPYVQPALSDDQQPVRYLMLALKAHGARPPAIDAETVRSIVHEYVRWAMRIPEPTRCAEYAEMARYLAACASIPLIPLGPYVGDDPERPLHIHEIAGATDPDLDATLAMYAEAFRPGPVTVAVDEIRRSLVQPSVSRPRSTYHLWALRASPDAPVAGMASFFGLPGAGFGGYVAFAKALQGTGRLRPLLARIERQLVEDRTGARGWYIECERDEVTLSRFRHAGFHEAALDYRQPALRPSPNAAAGVPLVLLYKEFGAGYGTPTVTVDEFRETLAQIYRVVYRVPAPESTPLYRLVARLAGASGRALTFRER